MAFNDIWGKEGLFAQGLRAKTRGRDAIAAAAERVNERQAVPDSIIGGQFVAGGDYANLNPALTGLRNREAYAQAVRQGNFGSSQLNAAALAPGRVGNTGSTTLNPVPTQQQVPGARAPLQGAQNVPNTFQQAPSAESYANTIYEDVTGGGFAPEPQATATVAQPVVPQSSNPVPNIADTESTVKTRTSDSLKRTTLGKTGSLYDEGYQDGGMVEKPRRVKQPGMRGFSKVTPPPGYKWGAMDPNEPPMPEPMPEPKRPPGYKWGMSEDEMGYCNSGRARKGMRGYAMGGQIGDEMEDDGKDTVDVRVREGEYLLNPDTVAAFGGGNYEAGVRTLDGIATAVNGVEPGPVPVNEEGEAMEEPKPGYAYSGSVMQVDPYGNVVETLRGSPIRTTPALPVPAQPRGPTIDITPKPAAPATPSLSPEQVRAQRFEQAGERAGKATRAALRKLPGSRPSLPLAGAAALEAGLVAGDTQLGQFYNDPNVPFSAKLGQAARTVGDVGLSFAGGTLGAGAGSAFGPLGTAAGGVGGYMLGDMIIPDEGEALRQYRLANQRQPTQQTSATPATAGAYYRPFTNAPVSLRNPDTTYSAAQPVPQGQQRVVQRTGGPGNEVIVREDVNGVPTFSNLRDRPFDVGASNLQAQADRRYAEDTAARQQLLENIARERELFDAATAPGALDRQAESEAALAKAIGKNDSSLKGMREAYTSLGLFTNPETGKIDDAQYNLFVDRVGAELAKEGININDLPPQAMMVLASEYSMARPTSNQFNRIVEGETGVNPNAVLTPQDVPAARPAEFWRDLGWGDAGSNVGFWHALRGKPVYDVNIPGTRGEKMTVTPDDLGFRDLRRKNYYEGR